jgi:hypothetical protein
MLNKRFEAHCFLCGGKLEEDEAVTKLVGRFCSNGKGSNSVWLHTKGCAERIITLIEKDIEAVS